jgi:hypothetical protein
MGHRDRIRYAAIASMVGAVLIAGSWLPMGTNLAGAQVPPTPTPSAEDVLKQLLAGLSGGAAGTQPGTSAPAQPITPAASPTPAGAPSQGVILADPLSSNVNGWPENAQAFFSGGKYHLISPFEGTIYGVRPTAGGARYNLADFSYEVTVQKVIGTEANGFGMLFRWDPTNTSRYYRFMVNGAGEYRLSKNDNTLDPQPVVDWTRSPAIRRGDGAINTLGVVCSGGRIDLYVNGVYLATAEDYASPNGYFGLFVPSNVEIAFSNLIVRELTP